MPNTTANHSPAEPVHAIGGDLPQASAIWQLTPRSAVYRFSTRQSKALAAADKSRPLCDDWRIASRSSPGEATRLPLVIKGKRPYSLRIGAWAKWGGGGHDRSAGAFLD